MNKPVSIYCRLSNPIYTELSGWVGKYGFHAIVTRFHKVDIFIESVEYYVNITFNIDILGITRTAKLLNRTNNCVSDTTLEKALASIELKMDDYLFLEDIVLRLN